MIRGSIYQEDITEPNITEPKYIKQTLTKLKGEKDSNTIILRNFQYSTLNNG